MLGSRKRPDLKRLANVGVARPFFSRGRRVHAVQVDGVWSIRPAGKPARTNNPARVACDQNRIELTLANQHRSTPILMLDATTQGRAMPTRNGRGFLKEDAIVCQLMSEGQRGRPTAAVVDVPAEDGHASHQQRHPADSSPPKLSCFLTFLLKTNIFSNELLYIY